MAFNYAIEHYMVCGLAVAVVKTPQDRVVQAWAADKSRKCMVRDGSLISDVESDSRVRPMSKVAFDAHCASYGIESDIPARAIEQTLMLVNHSENRSSANDARNGRSGSSFGALAIG